MSAPLPPPAHDKASVAARTITHTSSAIGRRKHLLPNLALAGIIGALVLVFALWLGSGRLGLFPDPATQPTLTITSPGPYTIGGSVTLRGDHFSPNSLIALLRDGQPATDAQGQRQAVETDTAGRFTATLPITPNWRSGIHVLSATDTTSQQRASVSLQIEGGGS
jgi:hypothetical protein